MIDAEKVEKLKIWYALFTTIMEDTTTTDNSKVAKLEKLKDMLELEIELKIN